MDLKFEKPLTGVVTHVPLLRVAHKTQFSQRLSVITSVVHANASVETNKRDTNPPSLGEIPTSLHWQRDHDRYKCPEPVDGKNVASAYFTDSYSIIQNDPEFAQHGIWRVRVEAPAAPCDATSDTISGSLTSTPRGITPTNLVLDGDHEVPMKDRWEHEGYGVDGAESISAASQSAASRYSQLEAWANITWTQIVSDLEARVTPRSLDPDVAKVAKPGPVAAQRKVFTTSSTISNSSVSPPSNVRETGAQNPGPDSAAHFSEAIPSPQMPHMHTAVSHTLLADPAVQESCRMCGISVVP